MGFVVRLTGVRGPVGVDSEARRSRPSKARGPSPACRRVFQVRKHVSGLLNHPQSYTVGWPRRNRAKARFWTENFPSGSAAKPRAIAGTARWTGRQTPSRKCTTHCSESAISALERHFHSPRRKFPAFKPCVDSTQRKARSEEWTVPACERTAQASQRPTATGRRRFGRGCG